MSSMRSCSVRLLGLSIGALSDGIRACIRLTILVMLLLESELLRIIKENGVVLSFNTQEIVETVACFVSGAAFFAAGVHLSYVNIAPQQARTKARNDFAKERLRKKYRK
ncbi:hypothetical protein SO802_001558 [Lithocarpus litseifolius]|uniref:Uncharacterized protein n=1 Tax=Lithocarpus litseifolius TaxID=425828 RepID=A0AAW2DWK7_9ROSI